jgi:hypothetical protein
MANSNTSDWETAERESEAGVREGGDYTFFVSLSVTNYLKDASKPAQEQTQCCKDQRTCSGYT